MWVRPFPETAFEEITERPELRKTTFSQPASWFMAKKEEIAPEFLVRHVPANETCRGATTFVQSGLKSRDLSGHTTPI
jgi:hypothetical protein